jgi:hypothetical protein
VFALLSRLTQLTKLEIGEDLDKTKESKSSLQLDSRADRGSALWEPGPIALNSSTLTLHSMSLGRRMCRYSF